MFKKVFPALLLGLIAVPIGGVLADSSASTAEAAGVTKVATADKTRPTTTLVSPTVTGPFNGAVTIQVNAADNAGLTSVTANIYQGLKLVRSTSTRVHGETTATHKATVDLPSGIYGIRYNAVDTAGNIATTKTTPIVVDLVAPTATVKRESVGANGVYRTVSYKLADAGIGQIDYVTVNGVKKDLSNNKWSDVNGIRPGVFGAQEGKNTLVVFDTAGNSSSYDFVLDTQGPDVDVKPVSVGANGVYSNVSVKLHDPSKVDMVTINGVVKDLTDNQWSDVNGIRPGVFGAVEGNNILVAYDALGNTTTIEFELDTVAPTATVKPESVGANGVYRTVSYKLADAPGQIDYVTINGHVKDLTNDKWSDVNGMVPGVFGAQEGNNTLVVFDTAGNSSSYTFVLDTNGGETPPDQTPQAPIVVNLDGEAASHVGKTVELPNQFLTEHTEYPEGTYWSTQVEVTINNTSAVDKEVGVMYADQQDDGGKIWIERGVFQDNWRHDNVIAANSSKTFVFDVWYDVPGGTTVVPSDLKLSFGVDATPIIAAAPVAPIVVNLDGEAASHVGKTVELPNQFLTEHTEYPEGTYWSTQVEVTINNTSAVDKEVHVMYADQQDDGGKIWIERGVFQDNWRHDNVIAANSSKTFVFDVWYDVPGGTTVVPSDLKLSFGVDATPIIAAAPVAPIVVNLDGEAASHVGKTVELPNQFLTEHTEYPEGTYWSTQVEVTINNTSAVDKEVHVMYADQQDGDRVWIQRSSFKDMSVPGSVIPANSSRVFVFDVWYNVPGGTSVVPNDLTLNFGVDATPIQAEAPQPPAETNSDVEAASQDATTAQPARTDAEAPQPPIETNSDAEAASQDATTAVPDDQILIEQTEALSTDFSTQVEVAPDPA